MDKGEIIKALNAIKAYCSNTNCKDCIFGKCETIGGEFECGFSSNFPFDWNISENKNDTQILIIE